MTMKRRPPRDLAIHTIRLAGVERHTLESLWLELRRLGRKYGVEVEVRVERTSMRRSA
jgi:hypothetical protein